MDKIKSLPATVCAWIRSRFASKHTVADTATATPSSTLPPPSVSLLPRPPAHLSHFTLNDFLTTNLTEETLLSYIPGTDPPRYSRGVGVTFGWPGVGWGRRSSRLELDPPVWFLGIPMWFNVHIVPVVDPEDMTEHYPDCEIRRCCLMFCFAGLVAGGVAVAFLLPKMT